MKQTVVIGIMIVISCSYNIFAQKNDIGFKVGLSIYGNSQLSLSYDGKYTTHNGTSREEGLYYTRFFRGGKSDITLNFDYTTRTKHVFVPIDPYKIEQTFYRIQALYNEHWSFNKRLSVGVGVGAYYTGWGDETWQYVDNTKDTLMRESGIDFLGLTLNVPINILLREPKVERKVQWNYIRINLSLSTDLFTSVSHSRLYTANISCLYGIRF